MQAIGRQQPSPAPEAAPCPPFTFAAGDDWQTALLGRDLADARPWTPRGGACWTACGRATRPPPR